jgi:predicted porin
MHMQKKLIAVAVAGVLGAPVVAFAQTSTVNIYGRVTYEYGHGDGGSAQHSTDFADTPGGANIGFRGEEKLGGGLSAWFQCETSADVRGIDQVGLCSRNSAVGFKGGFGNLHFGRWDTPFKRALNVGTVGAEETGLQGMSFLAFGGSGGADATGTGPDATNRHRWKRREVGLVYYESPVFSGMQILAAFSPGNAASDIAALRPSNVANSKPRTISVAGTFKSGGLGIGLGYERHNQYGAYAPASTTTNLDDRAWGVSAIYDFGAIEVGATYLDAKYETGPSSEAKKKTWTVGAEWNIAGPHELHAHFQHAGDTKGTAGGPGVNPTSNGGIPNVGEDTGGKGWSIGYKYNFSKRTWIKLAYVKIDNDRNARAYRVGNMPAPVAGDNTDSYAFRISHSF